MGDTTNIWLGESQYGDVVRARVEGGVIKGFDGFDHIDSKMSYDGNTYLAHCSWTHEAKIGRKVYKSGDKLDVVPKLSKRFSKLVDEAYTSDGGMCCDDCGVWHDTDQYHNVSFVTTEDGELFCKGCTRAEDVLIELTEANDVFKSKDVADVNLSDYEEIDTLFCDSSGLGASYERAMTKNSTIETVGGLLAKHKRSKLYAGLTGIGQFQVYVTIYKRKTKTKRKAA